MSTRHDLDLKAFEAILKKEKSKIEKNIEMIKSEVDSIVSEDEIDDTEDMAELQIDNATDQTLLRRLEDEVKEIDAALERIVHGTYGICEKTLKPIPLERLKANPWARTIVSE
jgi:DnaK suppressor protein